MKLIACVLALAGMAAGQEAPIITIAPGQQVSCVVPDSSKSGWHFEICKVMVTVLPPRSVPAVRKKAGWGACTVDAEAVAIEGPKTGMCWVPERWDCADPFRALIVSQNGKKAACVLVD